MKIKNTSTHLLFIDGKNVFPDDTVEINDSFAKSSAVHAMARTNEILIIEMPVEKDEEEVESDTIEESHKRGRKKKAE